jgi:predicted ArsR family transcriptional regulator
MNIRDEPNMANVEQSVELTFDGGDESRSISPIEERLIGLLKDGGPLLRDQLVKRMGIPRTTIYEGLAKLIARGEAKKFPFYASEKLRRGRPPVLFSLSDDKK